MNNLISTFHAVFRITCDSIRLSRTIYFYGERKYHESPFRVLSDAFIFLQNKQDWRSYISPFFDGKYYYEASPDVRELGIEPISHYLKHGWRELRSPSRYFDAVGFTQMHPHLSSPTRDAAETCLRLYGSYAWRVDGELVPTEPQEIATLRHFNVNEQKEIYDTWGVYRRHFDAQYYMQQYPEVCCTENEAFAHYMHVGFTEDRNPRRDFDGYHYRKKNQLARWQNPFRHWIDRMKEDGFSQFSPTQDKDLIEIKNRSDPELFPAQLKRCKNKTTLCIHVHCYYFEILSELIDRLQSIDWGFSIVVTVCNESVATAARKHLSGLIPEHVVDVVVVENRGRDIAPFLIDASPIWRESDLVLHLHTKRSPHVAWGDNWRRYLFDSTIGQTDIIEWVVNQFERTPNLGSLFPENYSMVRHYTESDSNTSEIERLAHRLGLEGTCGGPYAAGSMAFYRVTSLLGIIDRVDLEELFQKEQGQLDRTAAHAFERFLPEYIRKTGGDVKIYRIT